MSANAKKLVAMKSEKNLQQSPAGKTPSNDSTNKSTTTLRSSLKGKDKGPGVKPKPDAVSSSGKLSTASGSMKISTATPTVDKTPVKKKAKSTEVKAPPPKKKARVKAKKRSFIEKLAISMGFYVGNVVLQDPRAIEAAQALNLQQWHLRRLKARFDQIDIDGSGNIDLEEFFEAVGEARSPFTDKLFALIDLDGSGTIEFDEYVRVMATYCMFTKDEILRFCFECFDVDRSGSIDEREFIELCKCINNAAPSFPNNFKRALEEFDVNEDGLIDYG
eukprot:gene45479-55660_t